MSPSSARASSARGPPHHLQNAGHQVTLIDALGTGAQPRLVRRRIPADPRRLRQGRDLYPHGVGQPAAMEGAQRGLRLPILIPCGSCSSSRRGPLRPRQHRRAQAVRPCRPTCWTAPRWQRRFPMIDFDGIRSGCYEPDFGALMARRAVLTLVDRFVRAGGDYMKARSAARCRRAARAETSSLHPARRSPPTASSSRSARGCRNSSPT